MQGWIKLHRQLLDWEWYDDINTTRLFVHLLLVANHEDKNWRGIEIKRGQRLTSLDKLSKETGLSVSKLRTCLKKLKSTSEVTSKSHSQHTVFTIENYDSYQGNDKPDDKPIAYESQTNDKPLATNKNDKKEKKVRKVFTPPTADEAQAYFEERGFGEKGVGQRFVDFYQASGWMRGNTKIKDWKGCVRTWCGKMKPISVAPSQEKQKQDYESQVAKNDQEFQMMFKLMGDDK